MGLMEPMRRGRARRPRGPAHARPLARAAVLAGLVALLAACGSSGSSGTSATSASPAPTGSRSMASASAAAASFVTIVEPFDPGHPARSEPAPASCSQTATIAIEGITPPEARLKGTDSTDPNQLSWYTTPEGSRIAEINTQGDQTGGAIVAWVIVGGANGFVVNPRQFYFQDGSFTDPGVVEPPNPAYHRVPMGKEYQFSIDYSTLSKDPNANKSAAGYLYAPGTPVAIWG